MKKNILMQTDLAGKVNNLPNFKNEALLPVFEAVTNSIQAIQECGIPLEKGEIIVNVKREQALPESGVDGGIVSFEITDNGVGFNDENFTAFQTSDTTHKLKIGGKGIGRFLWLKAFDRVDIESIYMVNEKSRYRKFSFEPTGGIHLIAETDTSNFPKTTVCLAGFKKDYRDLPTAYKQTETIAQRILEHCLSYFIAGQAPKITVLDDIISIVLNNRFDNEFKENITNQELNINGQAFTLSHIKLYSTREAMHKLVLCADNREVRQVPLEKILGTGNKFDETEEKNFIYALYASSNYLNSKVNASRTDFDIAGGEMFSGADGITYENLEKELVQSAKEFLKPHLIAARKKTEEIVNQYVTENPALRCIPAYCPEVFEKIQPNSSQEKISEVLYLHKGKAEFAIREKSEKLLKSQPASFAELDASCKEIVNQLDNLQKDELAAYICKRKQIICILEKQLESNSGGKYQKEDIIHDIIFPRKTTTEEISFDDHNLWLIDENLVFHAFAASEKPLKQTISSESAERPDIVAFAEIDEDKNARSVSIIEFKRPQRDEHKEPPTDQVLRYLREIRGNSVRLPNGRDLRTVEGTRFYCYVVCDITDRVKVSAENGSFTSLKDGLGYYSYNGTLNAHIEILHFDKIVADAKKRHKVFFDKLGLKG